MCNGRGRECLCDSDLLLEITEDNRLRGLGINPDGDNIEVWFALERLMEKHEQERLDYLSRVDTRPARRRDRRAIAYLTAALI
jgi:hypothetical protein